MKSLDLCIVMPAWNEEEGIGLFLKEIESNLLDIGLKFVVVDDKSTDKTVQVVEQLANNGMNITLIKNSINLGHGPSTLLALKAGLESGASTILAIDGDGQFLGTDLALALNKFLVTQVDILEGIRTDRNEPMYRRLVSFLTRFLIWTRCGKFPIDGNTPFRIYSVSALRRMAEMLSSECLIPNLFVSANSRRMNLTIQQFEVASIPRRGIDATGTTWGKSSRILPSKRFIKFCIKGFFQWIKS